MPRTVFCIVDQVETDGLDFVPWPGPLGKRVFESVASLRGNAGSRTRPC